MPEQYKSKVFLWGLALGFLMWSFSKLLFGHKEPWDGNLGLYCLVQIIFSAVMVIRFASPFWLPYVALYAGQFLFFAYGFVEELVDPSKGTASLAPLGVIALLIFTLPTFVGAGLGSFLRER